MYAIGAVLALYFVGPLVLGAVSIFLHLVFAVAIGAAIFGGLALTVGHFGKGLGAGTAKKQLDR